KAESDKCEESTAGFKKDIAEKEERIAAAKEKIAELSEKRTGLNTELNGKRVSEQTLIEKANALQRMNDHFEGYAHSIKFVMREYEAGNIRGEVHGPLSSLISVDKRYITAIETALGNSLQNIVVSDESTAKAAINALKKANAGRGTFYPITAIKSPSELDEIKTAKKYSGYVGRADTLVKSDSKYRSIIEWLLLRTLVFDNLDNASVAAKDMRYRVKIVTLDGQVINAGGSFMGGSEKRDSGILSRSSEIDSMRSEAQKLSEQIAKLEAEIDSLDESIKENGYEEANAEQEKELLLALSRTQFAALDAANANLSANESMLTRLNIELKALRSNSTKIEEELKDATAMHTAALERIEALKNARSQKGEEMGVLDDFCDEMAMKANEAYIKATEIRKDIEGVDNLICAVEERIGELDSDIATEKARIAEYESQRSGIDNLKLKNKEEADELISALDELTQKRNEALLGADEFDREINLVRQQTRDKNAGRNVAYEAMLKNENRYNGLIEKQDRLGSQLYDEYEITYEEAVALQYPEVTAENREDVAKDQAHFKHELKKLGSYNVGAIEEYATVKIRYDDLNTQYTDLTSSYEELTGIIARLEVEMRTGFLTAFEAINKHFGHTFKELFGGGNAELSLTDPEDVLTSGIEIKAAPPGKIIKSLSLLSGGEQSFVAIALLFAILKVNPTPFCILDEIEAALDEVNVYRFGEYIKRLADETQFILITHRRGTMEVGNRLYGVTMPQRGISQAIEVNVDEIEGKQKELLG
ncbi:MAG: hypothetical protein IIX96_04685, partial [Clostridia bacterium]|nr:hypothetical protein [Clostridia bacterium]